ncbi:5-(carboxyamino)imidazole ribonucleotide synthase [Aquibacillus halophilus]|uniref:N5-carboxyaminoimidazole ribonucleotide synthase n=1 Tax=Aquibacillus halophilus TaxID=930132 RepID=A0A6A8DGT6_9BACI|nr:5-(carboxyamino)imidazole ribonucleotide synthase [Aquibacillus halophilus]MRH44905.1 5-(carboxyamino)imidazole ribonucleotide synthase [Aquibacillus halophilus]
MQQNRILPGHTIGIVGGGQLGRMMAIAAKHMGYRIVVLDPTPDCPTAQVSDRHIVADYDDIKAIKQLAELSDVVTYEFENVDLVSARYLEKHGVLPQGAELLAITQDRENEKKIIVKNNLPAASYEVIENHAELYDALDRIGFPAVLKTCRGGYDGKGQLKIESTGDIHAALGFLEQNGRCMFEQWLAFDKEISVVLTRTMDRKITFFPIAENQHENHILHKTIAPASISEATRTKALDAARSIAEEIGVVGTFAIEMFVQGEDIYINEMAPRPHNSGHFTIESCNVSQFEQHIRAICGLPLIPIEFQGASVMINLIGEDMTDYLNRMDELGGAHIHVYGKKEIKPNRKMGHITFVGSKLTQLINLVDNKQKLIAKRN